MVFVVLKKGAKMFGNVGNDQGYKVMEMVE